MNWHVGGVTKDKLLIASWSGMVRDLISTHPPLTYQKADKFGVAVEQREGRREEGAV